MLPNPVPVKPAPVNPVPISTPLQWAAVLTLLCLFLTACGSLAETVLAPQADALRLSRRADRASAAALTQAPIGGPVYIFATAPSGVSAVSYNLGGAFMRRTSARPFDLAGGTAARANALDTRTLANGPHTLRATFSYRNGRRISVSRTLTVANPPAPVVTPPAPGRWQPRPGLTWQWQLQGTLELSLAVDVYDLDLFDTPASTIAGLQARGKRVVCYFSAGSFEAWRSDAGAFPAAVKGSKMDGWDELWLDVRNIPALAPVMRTRLELAKRKGCDAVEPDNVDAYANTSGFPLTGADQLAYNRFLADEAHARGLAIGLKNDLEQVRALEPYFDFAVNEQCFQYSECSRLTPFIAAGKAVFGAEYERTTAAFCPTTTALKLSTIHKRYDLGVYREACP